MTKYKIGRPPDYDVKAARKTEAMGYGPTERVGVAWIGEKGNISIKFNAFVIVPTDGSVALSLWPRESKSGKEGE